MASAPFYQVLIRRVDSYREEISFVYGLREGNLKWRKHNSYALLILNFSSHQIKGEQQKGNICHGACRYFGWPVFV